MSDPTTPASKSKRKKKPAAQTSGLNELAPPEPVTNYGEPLSAANPFEEPPSRPYYANRPPAGMPHGIMPPGMVHPGMMPPNMGMPPMPNMAMQHSGVNMAMQHPGFQQHPGANMNMPMMQQFIGPPRNKFPPGPQPNVGPFDGCYPAPNCPPPNPNVYQMNMPPGMGMNVAGAPPMRTPPQQAGVCCASCNKMLVCDPNSEHQPITCGTCGAWYHRACTTLLDSAYHALYAEIDCTEWICEKCELQLAGQIPYVKWRMIH